MKPEIRKQIALSNLGVQQSVQTAEYLSHSFTSFNIEQIYVSDYLRACQTGQIISKKLELPISLENGIGARKLFTYSENNPDERARHRKLARANWNYCISGGDSINMSVNKFAISIQSILSQINENSAAIAVTHGSVLQSYLYRYFTSQFPDFDQQKLFVKPCSITRISYNQSESNVISFGYTDQLSN